MEMLMIQKCCSEARLKTEEQWANSGCFTGPFSASLPSELKSAGVEAATRVPLAFSSIFTHQIDPWP